MSKKELDFPAGIHDSLAEDNRRSLKNLEAWRPYLRGYPQSLRHCLSSNELRTALLLDSHLDNNIRDYGDIVFKAISKSEIASIEVGGYSLGQEPAPEGMRYRYAGEWFLHCQGSLMLSLGVGSIEAIVDDDNHYLYMLGDKQKCVFELGGESEVGDPDYAPFGKALIPKHKFNSIQDAVSRQKTDTFFVIFEQLLPCSLGYELPENFELYGRTFSLGSCLLRLSSHAPADVAVQGCKEFKLVLTHAGENNLRLVQYLMTVLEEDQTTIFKNIKRTPLEPWHFMTTTSSQQLADIYLNLLELGGRMSVQSF